MFRSLSRIFALLALLLPTAALAAEPLPLPAFTAPLAADNPLVGRIFDGATGAEVPLPEALERLEAAPYVVLGERHDNPDHHALQAYAVAAMAAAGRRPAVVWEMVDIGQQADLDAFLAGDPASPDGLADVLAWEDRGWPAFADYAPIFGAALAAGLPLRAGNLTREQVMSIARGGNDALPEAERQALSLHVPFPAALAEDLSAVLKASHCDMLPDESIPAMLLAQRARDGALARGMLDATGIGERGDGAVLITGSGHGRRDRAVPWVLEQAGVDGSEVVSVAFVEAEDGVTDPAAYEEARGIGGAMARAPYDLLWFTPRVDRGDPCAAFKDRT